MFVVQSLAPDSPFGAGRALGCVDSITGTGAHRLTSEILLPCSDMTEPSRILGRKHFILKVLMENLKN